MQSIYRQPVELYVKSVDRSWSSMNFIQLVEWHHSGGNILISIYCFDFYDQSPKKTKVHVREWWKNACANESSFTLKVESAKPRGVRDHRQKPRKNRVKLGKIAKYRLKIKEKAELLAK